MPRRTAAPVEDAQIRSLAMRFADDIARIVRSGITAEVSSQIGHVLEGISRGRGPALRLPAAAKGDRRLGKSPVPVTCPVPGCKNAGVRAKRNFCSEHAASLSDAEKKRMREAQLAARTGGAPAATGKKRGRKPGRPKKAAPQPRAQAAKKTRAKKAGAKKTAE